MVGSGRDSVVRVAGAAGEKIGTDSGGKNRLLSSSSQCSSNNLNERNSFLKSDRILFVRSIFLGFTWRESIQTIFFGSLAASKNLVAFSAGTCSSITPLTINRGTGEICSA